MFIFREPAEQMPRFPFVDQNFGVRRLITDLFGKAAMILVRVRKDDSLNVLKPNAMPRQ